MSFLTLSNLKAHTKVHAGYSCDVKDCDQHFPTWTELRKHKAEEHRKSCYNNLFQLTIIDFITKYFLTVHHCNICGKIFKRLSFLNSHMEKHKPNREVFHCPIDDCGRHYDLEKNLRQHIRMYHTPGQFKCEVEGCGAIFIWNASLKSHTARHFGGPKKCETTGPKPLRKPRSDKGKSKKSMAAILSGLTVSKEENDRLLKTID